MILHISHAGRDEKRSDSKPFTVVDPNKTFAAPMLLDDYCESENFQKTFVKPSKTCGHLLFQTVTFWTAALIIRLL